MLASPGIGSGLDINSLVGQLVAAEGAPVQFRLDREEAAVQARISAYGSIKSALSDFQTALGPLADLAGFEGRQVSVGDETIFTASADANSVRGSYAIQVEALAQAHKLRSSSYAGLDAVVGTGTLTVASGNDAFAIIVNEGNNTLADLRDAINESPNNKGVLATVVSSVDGQHLVLTSSETGAANAITVKASGGDGGLTDLVYDPVGGTTNLTEVDAPTDAELTIDGLSFTSSSNTVSGAIEGVTVDLLRADTGVAYNLSVGIDREASKEQIRALVESYNAVLEAVGDQTQFDAENFIGGPLLGDTTTRGILSQLRSTIGGSVNSLSALNSLAEIGITTDLDGKLSIDETVLNQVFDESFDEVGRLFASDGGFATSLSSLVETFLDTDGQIETRLEGLNTDVEDISEQREDLARRLEAVEARLFVQFNALDTLVAELNNTSSFLGQQLGSLPGFNSTP